MSETGKRSAEEEPEVGASDSHTDAAADGPLAKRTRHGAEEKPEEKGADDAAAVATPAPAAATPAAPATSGPASTPAYQQHESGPQFPDNMKPAVRARLEALFSAGKCRRDEIDLKILQSLSEFAEPAGLQIVSNFCEADMASIRNKSAFLAGVMKRFRADNPIVHSSAYGLAPGLAPGLGARASYIPPDKMWPSVQAKLDSLYSLGKIKKDDLDQRCLDQLKSIPEPVALEVICKFGEADLSTINSKAGFFMGIVKRFREQVFASYACESFLSFASYHNQSLQCPTARSTTTRFRFGGLHVCELVCYESSCTVKVASNCCISPMTFVLKKIHVERCTEVLEI